MPVTRTRRLLPPSIATSTVSPSSTNVTLPVQTRHDGPRGSAGTHGARWTRASAAAGVAASAIAQATRPVASFLSIRVVRRVTSVSLRAARAAPTEAARPPGGAGPPRRDAGGRIADAPYPRRGRGADPHRARARLGGRRHDQDELQPREPPGP